MNVCLETHCVSQVCDKFSQPLFAQLSDGRFDDMAAMPLMSVADWQSMCRSGRKRAWRAERLGYRFSTVNREDYTDDIFEINTSAEHRQGRPMSDSYRKRHEYSPLPVYPCERHQVRPYGVLSDAGKLVAYLWLYVCGQLRLCSSIIGHAKHLDNGVMFLLFRGMVGAEFDRDPDGVVMYHRWDNGTDGLRLYKRLVGLRETRIGWVP